MFVEDWQKLDWAASLAISFELTWLVRMRVFSHVAVDIGSIGDFVCDYFWGPSVANESHVEKLCRAPFFTAWTGRVHAGKGFSLPECTMGDALRRPPGGERPLRANENQLSDGLGHQRCRDCSYCHTLALRHVSSFRENREFNGSHPPYFR